MQLFSLPFSSVVWKASSIRFCAAGRENFLAAEADRALAEMCRRVSEQKALAVLCAHSTHKSMHVRAKVGCAMGVLALCARRKHMPCVVCVCSNVTMSGSFKEPDKITSQNP